MNKFDLNLVPIKYILGTFRDEKEYPTSEDILFLMTKRASDRGKKINPVTFTTTVLFKMIGEEYTQNAKLSISQLKEEGIITKGKETKTGTSYTILKNPFI